MNILVVSQYYYPEPFRINEICEALAEKGHYITVITGLPNYPDGEIYPGYKYSSYEETINGVKVIRCKIRPRKKGNKNLALNYISFVLAANKALRRLNWNFDIVYGYQLSPITSMIPAQKIAKQKGVPFLLYCLDLWPESIETVFHKGSFMYKQISALSKKIYLSADKICVTSPSFIDYLSELLGNNDNIDFLPQHASDLMANIHDYDFEKKSIKENIDFLFVGNVGSSQNIEGVIRALSRVENKRNIKLHIVGSGSSLDNVKEECRKNGLEGTVIFHGRQPKSELARYYHFADVCIVSLRKEGIVGNTIPGKLQEYMSAGKAILAFIDGDAALVVKKANCGISVSAEDEQRLADAFTYCLNKERISAWGKNSRAYYESNYTLAEHVQALEIEFRKMIVK